MSRGPSGSATGAGSIDTFGDHDWFRIDLRAGELYQFTVSTPISFLDSMLAVRNASGALLVSNNDGNVGVDPRDPLLTFRPAASASTLTGTITLLP